MGALLVALAGCTGNIITPDAGAPGCNGLGRSRCVDSVSLGARFGCAALGDQTVWCWGRNDESQLGYESSDLCPERVSNGQTRAVACHMYPLQVPGLAGATAVSAGGAHACAVLTTGELRCWGSNTRGQLGNGSALPSRAPVTVAGLPAVTSLASGAGHTCAVVAGGQVFCWGANDRGQLGVEAAPDQCGAEGATAPCARSPVLVTEVADAVEVVAGDAHTCVRTAGGSVQCWGTNTDAQLGAGTAGAMPAPRPRTVRVGASSLRGVRALAAGGDHTCALRDDGAVLCWGRHDRGQLGVAVPEDFAPCAHACIATAVPIVGYEGAPILEEPDAGFEQPIGDASTPMDATTPRDATAPRDATTPRDATAPRDATTPRDAPDVVDLGRDVVLPPAPAVTAISAGGAFSCIALSDRTLRCWGTNRTYELGNGRMNEGGAALTTVIASPGSASTNPLQGVLRVESGAATSCALLVDRSVKCWGTNEGGALGVGDVSERNGPVPMTW
jgi:alpha-tubulin suppressor-like RCC1 family protein